MFFYYLNQTKYLEQSEWEKDGSEKGSCQN